MLRTAKFREMEHSKSGYSGDRGMKAPPRGLLQRKAHGYLPPERQDATYRCDSLYDDRGTMA